MNAKKAKAVRREMKRLAGHLPERTVFAEKTQRLSECQRGAYQALKRGAVHVAV